MSVMKKCDVLAVAMAAFLRRFTGYRAGDKSRTSVFGTDVICIRLHSPSGTSWSNITRVDGRKERKIGEGGKGW